MSLNSSSPEEGQVNITGIQSDDESFESRPNGILLTSDPQHRLVPIYKLNYRVNCKGTNYFTGSNAFYSDYERIDGNNWNYNFMPGFETMYGYIFFNYHNTIPKKTTKFFK